MGIIIDIKRLIIMALCLTVFLLVSCKEKAVSDESLQEVFPPVPMVNVALFRINNLPVTTPYFNDQWTLVAFGDSVCENECRQRLKQMHKVDGVQKLYFVDGVANNKQLEQLLKQYPGISFTSGTTLSATENFNKLFTADFISEKQRDDFLYLVNPGAELEYAVHQNDFKVQQIKLLLNR